MLIQLLPLLLGYGHLAFGRMVVSEIETLYLLANLDSSGWAVVQSDNTTEPYGHHSQHAGVYEHVHLSWGADTRQYRSVVGT
jgi:hypothetical protein